MNPTIALVEVEGLHSQYNISLHLRPGLNVLYGKNGRGKTTLLHILANVLELDFGRFHFLSFNKLRIVTHGKAELCIHREVDSDGASFLQLALNGRRLGVPASSSSPDIELSHEERFRVRDAIGAQPVYLPAFRAILERAKSESYSDGATRHPEFERIREQERLVERESERGLRRAFMGYRDTSSHTARKTVQCREWFGNFVPVIRYPSTLEVTEKLVAEYREALLEIGMQERRMLSETFVSVLKALLSEETQVAVDVQALLDQIRKTLSPEESHSADAELYTDGVGVRLARELEEITDQSLRRNSADLQKVLALYLQTLETRNQERRGAFAQVRKFEAAVNKFLDNKTLRVTDDRRGESVATRAGVYVETEGQRAYPLSALSSGERQVVTMLFSASRMSTARGLFLVDEPELSLHIDWQRIILGELSSQAGDRQIIACTHSPEVGADHIEALQVFEPVQVVSLLPPRPLELGDSSLEESL